MRFVELLIVLLLVAWFTGAACAALALNGSLWHPLFVAGLLLVVVHVLEQRHDVA